MDFAARRKRKRAEASCEEVRHLGSVDPTVAPNLTHTGALHSLKKPK